MAALLIKNLPPVPPLRHVATFKPRKPIPARLIEHIVRAARDESRLPTRVLKSSGLDGCLNGAKTLRIAN